VIARASGRMAAVALATAWAAFAASAVAGDDDGFVLRDKDRVVFYGDSITQQRLYTRYVRQFVHARYPERDIRFFNAGWGGDTAPGGLKRLDRDVLELKPTVVTLFFGMNDGRYRTPDAAVTARFAQGLEGIVKKLREQRVRVIVFSPGCVDGDRKPNLAKAKYNGTLAGLGKEAARIAKANDCLFVDVHHPMLAFQTAEKKRSPKFTMIPDAVHPSGAGHLVMADIMLRGMGADPVLPLGTFDAGAGIGDGLVLASADEGNLVLETTGPAPIPFWIDDKVESLAVRCGLLPGLGGQELRVPGLETGRYEVTIDERIVGAWTDRQLSIGVRLAGTYSRAGKSLHDMVEIQEREYYEGWRNLWLVLERRAAAKPLRGQLLALDETLHGIVRELAQPKAKTRITLSRVPSGINLALRASYECSDPNRSGWGKGGLTDGSWIADARHCFATGNGKQFPKTVTVDFERAQRIAVVRLGVPAFGSTRSVTVSTSMNGRKFNEVASELFEQAKGARRTFSFKPTRARYVRLTYVDNHARNVGFTPEYCFTTELEVYGPE